MPISEAIEARLRANDNTLTELNLYGQNLRFHDICLLGRALFHNTHLTTLILSSNNIDYKGAIVLSKLTHVTSLELDYNKIDDRGAIALSRNQSFRSLSLVENLIDDEGAIALAQNPRLTHLNLLRNRIESAGALALAGHPGLTSLYLGGNQIGGEAVIAIAQNSRLTTLNLEDMGIALEGLNALAENLTLKSLELFNNQIDAKGARVLSKNTSLTYLNLANNPIGNQGAMALAKHPKLQVLDLEESQVTDSGAMALAKNTRFSRLFLEHNCITSKGAKAFEKNKTLASLDLFANKLGPKAALDLATKNKRLTTLRLGWNGLDGQEEVFIKAQIQENRRQHVRFLTLASIVSHMVTKGEVIPGIALNILSFLDSDVLGMDERICKRIVKDDVPSKMSLLRDLGFHINSSEETKYTPLRYIPLSQLNINDKIHLISDCARSKRDVAEGEENLFTRIADKCEPYLCRPKPRLS